MLKLTTNLKVLTLTTEVFNPNFTRLETVRWARQPRKPLWLPTAKSKLFRVPPRRKLPEEEREELERLHNNYRTQVKSLKNYFAKKYAVENVEQFDIEQHRKAIEEDFIRCTEINSKWNTEIKLQREKRVDEEFKYSIEDAKKRLEERVQLQGEQLAEAEEIVRKEKEASKDFITLDKLDAAIEYAINNPVDYNFAIDLDGSKIRGRETKPPVKTETKKVRLKQ